MKFTIDIEDFWIDEEDNLSSALEKHIVDQLFNKIYKSIEAKLEKDIISKIDTMVADSLYKKANLFISDFLKNGKIKSRVYENNRNVDKEISIEEHIRNKFKSDSGWASPNDKIEKLAKAFGDEMKKRYDLLFATQIVSKLGDKGLLRDEVMKQLVENIMDGKNG